MKWPRTDLWPFVYSWFPKLICNIIRPCVHLLLCFCGDVLSVETHLKENTFRNQPKCSVETDHVTARHCWSNLIPTVSQVNNKVAQHLCAVKPLTRFSSVYHILLIIFQAHRNVDGLTTLSNYFSVNYSAQKICYFPIKNYI